MKPLPKLPENQSNSGDDRWHFQATDTTSAAQKSFPKMAALDNEHPY